MSDVQIRAAVVLVRLGVKSHLGLLLRPRIAGRGPQSAHLGAAEFALAITVRVIARNAMFVGDLVEGAQVTVTDAVTGEMLAQGVTAGHAGDAKRIMGTARKRGTPVAGETDAHFTAALELDEPRYVQVTAFGPLQRRQSATRPSMTQWIVRAGT